MEKNKIFLSHRHSDTQSDCHRIRETLEEEFGKDAVFLDIENLEPGIRFADAIEKALAESKVVLVAIGPDWFGAPDENGVKRLFQPKDWVHREVSAALSRPDTRVIPLLLKGASRPTSDQLPEDLQELADLQTFEISITRWKYDLGVLVEALAKLIPRKKKAEPEPTPHPRPVHVPKPPKSWWAKNYLWVLGIFVVLIVLMISSEDFQKGYQEGLNGTPATETDKLSQADINTLSEDNPAGTVTYENLESNNNNTAPPASQASFDYSGKWWIWEEGVRMGYIVINQDGFYFTFDYYFFNQKTGEGTGEYDGTYLYSTQFKIIGDPNNYGFTFGSNDGGISWVGQTFNNGIPATAEMRKD
ncbi:toll/interleukin-1 receptor domain-containing protein [Algoriphagus sp. AGSA1]|uniref:toll/interleukin-1 receptor domain-containing protein n=1 Tax=Algoriphagus sp. AGSA1 TaxID=2907213 RepID=UPI001F1D63BD|nr:toll/interleukin-1 receptor domain-containing protein [Algoriphagus sp. AGSA1]MCE7056999.1 toll/interleukin-1 receptor domain-containing protein [Algoriphagus sp. AGSA1]